MLHHRKEILNGVNNSKRHPLTREAPLNGRMGRWAWSLRFDWRVWSLVDIFWLSLRDFLIMFRHFVTLLRRISQSKVPAKGGAPPRFEIKKWNAVAMWSWDICADTVCQCMLFSFCSLRVYVHRHARSNLTSFYNRSVLFVEIVWMNRQSNTKPTRVLRTIMVCQLPLETVVMCFIWIASSDGWRPVVCVHYVTKNGTLQKSKESPDMASWESNNENNSICEGRCTKNESREWGNTLYGTWDKSRMQAGGTNASFFERRIEITTHFLSSGLSRLRSRIGDFLWIMT